MGIQGLSSKIKSVVVDNSAKVVTILGLVSKSLNPKKYEFLISQEESLTSGINQREEAYDGIGLVEPHKDELEEDERVVDHETTVRNLKSNRLELREKLFVDKSIKKQLEVTMEEKSKNGLNISGPQRMNNKGYFSNDIMAM